MKKILLITLLCFVFLTGCDNKNNKDNNDNTDITQIKNVTVSSKEIPEFIIFVKGIFEDNIVKTDITDLTAYDIVVETKNNESNTWTGIRLADVLNKKGIKNFDSINVIGANSVIKTIDKDKINDDIYLVFYRNDELTSEVNLGGVVLCAPTYGEDYLVSTVYRIEII